jgi:diguanylate cyclase (GGDEF)-like protein
MADFFVNQLDFILFFYGLAFILLGSICVAASRGANTVIAWSILGIFGYVHGISEWLDLSALVFSDSPAFALVRTAVMTLSFMALFEFGRREAARLLRNIPGAWIQIPLLALPVLGWYLAGTGGANALARYALGLTGALLTSFVLLQHAKKQPLGERRWLHCASAAFLLYGVAAGAIVPNVAHWSGDFFNYDDFTRLTHVPIQFVRGVLACYVSFSVWAYWGQWIAIDVASARYSRFRRRQFAWTLAALAAILVGGWILTEYLGDIYKQNVRQESGGDLNLIVSRLNGETATVDGMVKALAGSRSIGIMTGRGAGDEADRGNAVLRLQTEASGAIAGFILDATGRIVATTETGDVSLAPNGKTSPYFIEAMAGRAGHYFAFDARAKLARYYASFPIRRSGDVIGVAVLEKAIDGLARDLRQFDRLFALVDADGVAMLSNQPDMVLRPLWPLTPEQAARARAKFGPLNGAPPLAQEISGSVWTTFNGTRDFVERRVLPHSDWSLITWKAPQGIFASRVLGIIITLQMTILALVYLIGRDRWIHDNIQLEKRLELEELARNLDFRAATDPLTGLYNRRKFDRSLATEILRAQRYKTPLSLILYDVDHFKGVNDTYGHPIGDKVLTELSRFVSARIRDSDILARWGGEEFSILCPNSSGAMACQLAGNLRDAIAAHVIEGPGKVTCSFGIAQYEEGDTPEALLARADDALYLAKLHGRNTFELAPALVASPSLQGAE